MLIIIHFNVFTQNNVFRKLEQLPFMVYPQILSTSIPEFLIRISRVAMPNEGFKFTIKILVLQGKIDENSIKFRVKSEIVCSGFRNIYKYKYVP